MTTFAGVVEPQAVTKGKVVAHPLLRIDPPTGGSRLWTVSRLGDRKGLRVVEAGVAVLVLASTPVDRATVVEELAGRGVAHRSSRLLLRELEGHGLLLDPMAPAFREVRPMARELDLWHGSHWRAAAAYHFQTYGYEFETYQPDGSSNEDARRMHHYAGAEADADRGKEAPPGVEPALELPLPEADLAPAGLLRLSTQDVAPAPLDTTTLGSLLSLVALPVGESRLPWPGAAPVWRKTSPSGGSRHPTEFYLRVLDVAGIAPGWYHVATPSRQLVPVRTVGPEDAALSTFFSGLVAHADFEPRAVLVYSCTFRRNRYRYREPRTFRTIHMDVGHLMGTAQLTAAATGLAAAHLTVIRGRALAEHLGLDPLVECPLAATFLGTHHVRRDDR